MSLHIWCHHRHPCNPSSCATFTFNPHWGRAATGEKKKIIASMQVAVTLVMPNFLWPCGMWPARGVLQERILEGIGQYWLPSILEHYISCFPSHQLPWVPGAARTPGTQEAAPPAHLDLTGANPSPPGQPQEQTPVDDPHAEVEIKPQLKSKGSVAEEEDPKPSHQLYKQQIKSTWSTRQTLCLWYI